VRERLGIVAEVFATDRVELLSVEPERTAERHELAEQCVRFVGTAGPGEGLREPERAREEGTFAAGEAVGPGPVAVQLRPAGV
jgi:hypothetical protein